LPQVKLGNTLIMALRFIIILSSVLMLACSAKNIDYLQEQEQSRGIQRIKKSSLRPSLYRRTALIIGNSAYTRGGNSSKLVNPAHDASDLAIKLKKLHFKLINNQALLNANKSQIKQAVREFKQKLKQGGIGLFFYAGHGMQINGTNYLIPLGSKFQSKADVEFDAVKLNWILAELEEAGNSVNLILLDACRDNPFRDFRGGSQGLAESSVPEGSLISFATSPGNVSSDGFGLRNSPYTTGLLMALETKGLEVLELFKAVRRSVKSSTHNKQVPWESHSLTEDIYLNGLPTDKAAAQKEVLEQLQDIKLQQRVTEKKLQLALKQQKQQIKNSPKNPQVINALLAVGATVQNTGKQVQKIGAIAVPSVQDDATPAMKEAVMIKNLSSEFTYFDNKDGTVTDQRTGLQWMKCTLGQQWQMDTCIGGGDDYSWQGALNKSATFYYADYSGWRLPTIEELKTLIYCSVGKPKLWNDTGEFCQGHYQEPTIFRSVFPNTVASAYWSSSTYAWYDDVAWAANFSYGYSKVHSRNDKSYVRLVRSVH